MKKSKLITLILTAALSASITVPVFAAPIPREITPLNATEQQVHITENIISDILDEVQAGNLGYTLAAGYANTRIRKTVIAGQTDGNGYGILSPIAQNAIRSMIDVQLRPEAYAQAEEELKALLADLITDVENGKDYEEAWKEAYIQIYKSKDAKFNPDDYADVDFCYWPDIPAVDSAYFNRARKLLNNAYSIYLQK